MNPEETFEKVFDDNKGRKFGFQIGNTQVRAKVVVVRADYVEMSGRFGAE
jgi:hypothetical protein